MELRHIRYFMAVAEEGSFTRAAEKLMIAQPPLSRQIRDLEEELGTDLFMRNTRNLQLTEAGQRFFQYATKILELAEQATDDISEMTSGLKGMLYLSSVEGQAPHLIAEWISEFHRSYPQVEYNLWNGNSDDVMDRVRKGLCEIAVITEPYSEEFFEGVRVYSEPWVALIPEENPLAKVPGDIVTLKDLAEYELIIPSRKSRKSEIDGWFASVGCEPKVIGRMAHMISAYELTKENVGIAIYPAASATMEASKSVCIKRLTEPDVYAHYVIIRSREHYHTHLSDTFFEFVKEKVSQKKDSEEKSWDFRNYL